MVHIPSDIPLEKTEQNSALANGRKFLSPLSSSSVLLSCALKCLPGPWSFHLPHWERISSASCWVHNWLASHSACIPASDLVLILYVLALQLLPWIKGRKESRRVGLEFHFLPFLSHPTHYRGGSERQMLFTFCFYWLQLITRWLGANISMSTLALFARISIY